MTSVAPSSPTGRKSSSMRTTILVVLALAAAGLAIVLVNQRRHAYHLASVQEGVLYRDGLKSPEQFAATLEKVHPKTVVSLLDPTEVANPSKTQFAKEESLCAAKGAKLVRIPVALGGWPTSEDVRQFIKIVSDPQDQPVLVHCAQGVRRTGFFVAAYQESVLGYDAAKAKDSIVSFGHSGNTIDDVKRFIDRYDPKTQTAPGDLGRGSE